MIDLIRRILLRPGYAVLCLLAAVEINGVPIVAPWLGWIGFVLICFLAIGTFIVTASIRNIGEAAFWVVLFIILGVCAGVFLPDVVAGLFGAEAAINSGSLLAGACLGVCLWIFCLIPKKELPQ